ncbi:MAG: hypothetical protein U5K30_14555 [Acidimicrobiales bacterium]|nr:hypothetical protein [Acidimicrobiales bacterium]
MSASSVIPADADLPGSGWLAIDDGLSSPGGDGPGTVLDCVGPEFPDDAVVASATSPHFLRPPAALVHGVGVEFADEDAAARAEQILAARPYAECLGRAVAADLVDGADAGTVDAELLGVEVTETAVGHRAQFTGGSERGVRPVILDVVCVRVGASVGVLWCGDTPQPFPPDDRGHLVARLHTR